MRKDLNPLLSSMALAGEYTKSMPMLIDSGNPPKQFGMSYRKNQRKARKQKRQNPHKY